MKYTHQTNKYNLPNKTELEKLYDEGFFEYLVSLKFLRSMLIYENEYEFMAPVIGKLVFNARDLETLRKILPMDIKEIKNKILNRHCI